MGTWGFRSFENDDAMDWFAELVDKPITFVTDTLTVVTDHPADKYLEAPDAARALAAAELVANAPAVSSSDLQADAAEWLGEHRDALANLGLKSLAVQALKRIELSSELKDLYDEAGLLTEWLEVTSDLEARLQM